MAPATISSAAFELFLGATPISGAVSYDAGTRTATFNPAASLATSTLYEARVAMSVTDLAENPLAQDYVWTFSTAAPDTRPPEVSFTSPTNGTVGVATGTAVSVAFDEDMDASSLTTTSFQLIADGDPLDGEVSYDAGSRTATFDPAAELSGSKAHTARVTTGARDAAGNALGAEYTWSFTMHDRPGHDATDRGPDLAGRRRGWRRREPRHGHLQRGHGREHDATATVQLLIGERGERCRELRPGHTHRDLRPRLEPSLGDDLHRKRGHGRARRRKQCPGPDLRGASRQATPLRRPTFRPSPPRPATGRWCSVGQPHEAADFAGVLVLVKTGGAPLEPADGTILFDGAVEGLGTTCTHSDAVNGTVYYYQAFSFDSSGNTPGRLGPGARPGPRRRLRRGWWPFRA
ncbi:MAG: Ig-like domain-containing protein [Rhodopseudomonas palustris]|nr:Ig-like domain-containing protein [Rhodopseudomonas palustris]